ncbi:MAG: ABC transporter substrate-binding protein [Myxococcaceae bacterium]|nr:ABC transporter substrate-binding protein [Myxococcaceae bacterium]
MLRFAVSCLVGAFLLGCPKSAGPAPVIVGVSVLRISQPVFVAAQRGLFAKHGVEVQLRRFDTAQAFGDELSAGRLDAAGYVAFPILSARAAPPAVRALTAVVEDDSHPLSFLLVKKGAGGGGLASLAGKRVGVLPTVAYERWLAAILEDAGVPAGAVSVVPLAPGQQLDALASGGVEALFTGDPMATVALARGIAEPATRTAPVPHVFGSPFLFGTFAVRAAFADAHPAEVRALTAALDEAIELMRSDAALGPAALSEVVREAERPFLASAPPTRYLRSTEVTAEALQQAFESARGLWGAGK